MSSYGLNALTLWLTGLILALVFFVIILPAVCTACLHWWPDSEKSLAHSIGPGSTSVFDGAGGVSGHGDGLGGYTRPKCNHSKKGPSSSGKGASGPSKTILPIYEANEDEDSKTSTSASANCNNNGTNNSNSEGVDFPSRVDEVITCNDIGAQGTSSSASFSSEAKQNCHLRAATSDAETNTIKDSSAYQESSSPPPSIEQPSSSYNKVKTNNGPPLKKSFSSKWSILRRSSENKRVEFDLEKNETKVRNEAKDLGEELSDEDDEDDVLDDLDDDYDDFNARAMLGCVAGRETIEERQYRHQEKWQLICKMMLDDAENEARMAAVVAAAAAANKAIDESNEENGRGIRANGDVIALSVIQDQNEIEENLTLESGNTNHDVVIRL